MNTDSKAFHSIHAVHHDVPDDQRDDKGHLNTAGWIRLTTQSIAATINTQ